MLYTSLTSYQTVSAVDNSWEEDYTHYAALGECNLLCPMINADDQDYETWRYGKMKRPVLVELTLMMLLVCLLGTSIGAIDIVNASTPRLTVWWKKNFVPASNDMIVDRIREFEQLHGVKVDVEIIPYEDMYLKWAAAIETKTTPDVSYLGFEDAQQFKEMGVLRDLTDLHARICKENEDFYPAMTEAVTADGRQWAIPFWAEASVLYYRKDLLEKAGVNPPDTWEEFREVARATTDPSSDIYGAGFGISPACSDSEWWIRDVLWSYGGQEVLADGKTVAINSAATEEAFTFISQLFTKDKVTPPGAMGWDDSGNNQAYLSGQAVMVINTGSVLNSLRTSHTDLLEKTGIALVPQGPKGRFIAGIYNNVGIFANTKHPEIAENLIAFLCEYEWYRDWIEVSNTLAAPVYPSMENDPFWRDPINQVFVQSTRYFKPLGYPGPHTAAVAEVYNSRLFSDALQRVIVDGWSVAKAVAELETRMKAIYARYF